MIVDNVWKSTNTVRVGLDVGPHTHRDNPLSRIMCAPIVPPVTVCHTVKIGLLFCFFFCYKKNFHPSFKNGEEE
jgi:hypothetical protein